MLRRVACPPVRRRRVQDGQRAKRINANGTYDFPPQIAKWRDRQTYASAVRAGNNPWMIKVHDNLAELMGFDDVNSEKIIAGVKGLRITSPAD